MDVANLPHFSRPQNLFGSASILGSSRSGVGASYPASPPPRGDAYGCIKCAHFVKILTPGHVRSSYQSRLSDPASKKVYDCATVTAIIKYQTERYQTFSNT